MLFLEIFELNFRLIPLFFDVAHLGREFRQQCFGGLDFGIDLIELGLDDSDLTLQVFEVGLGFLESLFVVG